MFRLLLSGTAWGVEVPTPLDAAGIRNAFRVTEHLFCGSHPEGDAGFAELARLGVKTIVSVDGNKPDVVSARKHGLRYIHLPFGYDSVPPERVVDLVSVAVNRPGPIYVHCRLGRYRAPAAVAVMCEATAGWTPERAEAWLKRAGKGNVYSGLAQSVRDFQQPTSQQLARVGDLPEIAKTSEVVDAMVAFDDCFEALAVARKAAWHLPSGHPLPPEKAASRLLEQIRELASGDDTALRDPDYRAKLGESEKAVEVLRDSLTQPMPDTISANAALDHVGLSCAACHKAFRDKKR